MTAHLVHGMGTGLEAPVWPAITQPEAVAVLAQFAGAGRVQKLLWHSPRPFSAAALAQTDAGTIFIKRHDRRLRGLDALAAEHGFIAHLARRGLPVAQLLHTADGAGAISRDGWSWEAHRQAPGLDLYADRQSWTPYLSLSHAFAAGAALARLHQAAAGYHAPGRADQPLMASFTILPSSDPLAAAEAYISARPALLDYLAAKPWRAALARLFAAFDAPSLAVPLAARPALWTHNDWHPSNLLWTEAGGVASVIDFGLADRSCALHDLAIALERGAVRWLELGRGAIAETRAARALLAGYHGTQPLTQADRALLARLLPLVHVEFALAEADYFHGVLGRRGDADLAWDAYLIGHAEWFLTPEGRGLLAAVGETPQPCCSFQG